MGTFYPITLIEAGAVNRKTLVMTAVGQRVLGDGREWEFYYPFTKFNSFTPPTETSVPKRIF